jgi:hypothetical protein
MVEEKQNKKNEPRRTHEERRGGNKRGEGF